MLLCSTTCRGDFGPGLSHTATENGSVRENAPNGPGPENPLSPSNSAACPWRPSTKRGPSTGPRPWSGWIALTALPPSTPSSANRAAGGSIGGRVLKSANHAANAPSASRRAVTNDCSARAISARSVASFASCSSVVSSSVGTGVDEVKYVVCRIRRCFGRTRTASRSLSARSGRICGRGNGSTRTSSPGTPFPSC